MSENENKSLVNDDRKYFPKPGARGGKILLKRQEAEPNKTPMVTPEVDPYLHKNIVVDSRVENLDNLVVHVEGYPWKVNYYQQIINDNNALRAQNPTKSEIHQQYHFIEDMVLKVSSPLSSSQDESTKSFNVTGSANLYPPFKPNTGDMFIGDIGDGRMGIFTITNSERKSILKESTYEISYVLVDYAKGNRILDLENKVIKRSYFSIDFLENGQNPIIHESEYKLIKDLKSIQRDLTLTYLMENYSTDRNCMAFRMGHSLVYEHHLSKAILDWFDQDDYYQLRNFRMQAIQGDPVMEHLSIYDVISRRLPVLLKRCFRNVMCVCSRPRNMDRFPILLPLAYSGMQYFVYPTPLRRNMNELIYGDSGAINAGFDGQPDSDTDYYVNHSKDGKPIIYPINLNESYVFSQAFYNEDKSNMSHLELQLHAYLHHQSLNAELLMEMASLYDEWGDLERFYYTPFVLVLIHAYLRSM